MESQILFPKDQRLKEDPKILNNSFGEKEITILLGWIEKYDNALNVAEKELITIGTEIVYSKEILPNIERLTQGMHIGTGKFGYYGLLKTISKYKNALKSAEQQIQKLI